jgi:hypothetical protein
MHEKRSCIFLRGYRGVSRAKAKTKETCEIGTLGIMDSHEERKKPKIKN